MTNYKTSKLPYLLVLIMFSLLLSGCSGVDDLRVSNNNPFPISLWTKAHDAIGTVPGQKTVTFEAAGGYGGDRIEGIQCTDEHNKTLGTIHENDPNISRENVSWLNGAATWHVTIGPAGITPENTQTVLNDWNKMLIICFSGVIVGLFIREIRKSVNK